MRSIISALAASTLLSMMLLGSSPSRAQTTKPGHGHAAGHAQNAAHMHAQYECTHCNIRTMKAGKCPVCKMKMTKVSTASAKKAQFECTHCQIQSAKAGKCPVCKMDMTKMKNASSGSKAKS